jgi:hypothetical protein
MGDPISKITRKEQRTDTYERQELQTGHAEGRALA